MKQFRGTLNSDVEETMKTETHKLLHYNDTELLLDLN
jgi:hypothetical protein